MANDVESVGVANELGARFGVHADLHEYSPRLHEEHRNWMRYISPFYAWMCRRHVSRASSWSTVSSGLAAEYEREFGFRPMVVTNATPFRQAVPSEAASPLRLVHSGAGLRNRQLELTVEAACEVPSVTLDLFLTPNDPAYVQELRTLASQSAGRVRVHDPVPYAELVDRLADYDVGIFVLPPINSSYRWALPNKLFDFIQARLAVVVGPSPEMASYVWDYGLGEVTEGFGVADIVRTLRGLTVDSVNRYKQASHVHAEPLSAQSQVKIWRDAITRLEE
ncbi:glycosyltransferase family 1 protein, partial [Microbacterium sp. OR21]|uniref:glycosyltransferase family 1 protein n=1 Tax=Microbacterium sp. OR21 TaxID=3095346 RepID=UPI0039B65FAD